MDNERDTKNPIGRNNGGRLGAAVSAANRKAISDAAIDRHVRPFWKLSSKAYPTADLERASGVVRNTIARRLGNRQIAQYNHRQAQVGDEANLGDNRRGAETSLFVAK